MAMKTMMRGGLAGVVAIGLVGCASASDPQQASAAAAVAPGSDHATEHKREHNSEHRSDHKSDHGSDHASGHGGEHHDNNPRPYDPTRDAAMDVEATLLAAKASGKNAALILGGNWCHDSRGMAAKLITDPLKTLVETHYELVYVDVGRRDRNLEIAKRYGIEELIGTPTILIVSPDGELLNGETVHDWRTADSRSMAEAMAYFAQFVPAD